VALRVVRRVTEEGAYSNLALAGELDASPLDQRDRRFAADMAYGTLRSLLTLDASIERAANRSLDRIDPETLAVLRLGAYQLERTRVPAHAAVSETVSLGPTRSRGFVNAVLRRLAVTDVPADAAVDERDDEAVSVRTGLSPWAVAELRRLVPPGEVEAAAAGIAGPAPLTLRANRVRTTADALAAALVEAGLEPARGRHHPDVLHVASATPAALPGFKQGWFTIQDEASVLVAAAVEARPGERILDACAGPGGKASLLASLVAPGGAVIAADASRARARLVRDSARRLGLRIPVIAQDASHPGLLGASFDAVLVDAPCSGMGAARRRPELLWRVSKERLPALARLQMAILNGAADLVRPGGRLVYSVCTFPRAETDAVVRSFLAGRPDFEPAEVTGPDGPAVTQRLWPHRHGTDGMFYAGFTRVTGSTGEVAVGIVSAPKAPGPRLLRSGS
jgi:16S rRNA (cytosine967-C5)-methyltransferase